MYRWRETRPKLPTAVTLCRQRLDSIDTRKLVISHAILEHMDPLAEGLLYKPKAEVADNIWIKQLERQCYA